MSLDLSRWLMFAQIDLAAEIFDAQALAEMRYEIFRTEYKGSLAPGLPPIPPEVVAEQTDGGIRVGCYVISATEREA